MRADIFCRDVQIFASVFPFFSSVTRVTIVLSTMLTRVVINVGDELSTINQQPIDNRGRYNIVLNSNV